MKKVMLLTGAMLALTSVAFASPGDKAKKPADKTEISCAVMKGDMVNIKKATADKMFADHNGRRYFFCCPGCTPKFKANPTEYAKADSIPTPKAKKGDKPKKG